MSRSNYSEYNILAFRIKEEELARDSLDQSRFFGQ
ncbi:MAG: hypothetical protein QOD12_2310 [Verrucomicrobiota bacterium]